MASLEEQAIELVQKRKEQADARKRKIAEEEAALLAQIARGREIISELVELARRYDVPTQVLYKGVAGRKKMRADPSRIVANVLVIELNYAEGWGITERGELYRIGKEKGKFFSYEGPIAPEWRPSFFTESWAVSAAAAIVTQRSRQSGADS
jgi:hypothetical protein